MKKLLFALLIISGSATAQTSLPEWDTAKHIGIKNYDDAVYKFRSDSVTIDPKLVMGAQRLQGYSNTQLGFQTVPYGSDITPRPRATGERDTIPAVFLVSVCVPCDTKTINGFVVRQKWAYFGDLMPTGYGAGYGDQWREEKNLTALKKDFDSTVIIWQTKTK